MERREVEKLAEYVRRQLAGPVRELRLLLRDNGLVLQEHCHGYRTKQLAHCCAVEATCVPVLASDIKVLR
jgi:hypothetical protein